MAISIATDDVPLPELPVQGAEKRARRSRDSDKPADTTVTVHEKQKAVPAKKTVQKKKKVVVVPEGLAAKLGLQKWEKVKDPEGEVGKELDFTGDFWYSTGPQRNHLYKVRVVEYDHDGDFVISATLRHSRPARGPPRRRSRQSLAALPRSSQRSSTCVTVASASSRACSFQNRLPLRLR